MDQPNDLDGGERGEPTEGVTVTDDPAALARERDLLAQGCRERDATIAELTATVENQARRLDQARAAAEFLEEDRALVVESRDQHAALLARCRAEVADLKARLRTDVVTTVALDDPRVARLEASLARSAEREHALIARLTDLTAALETLRGSALEVLRDLGREAP